MYSTLTNHRVGYILYAFSNFSVSNSEVSLLSTDEQRTRAKRKLSRRMVKNMGVVMSCTAFSQNKKFAHATPFVLALTLASSDVFGQQSTAFLEEVIVTAQKREQSAADVGVAISAFSGEQMRSLNFTTAAEVSVQSPNVEVRRHFVGRGLTTNLFIRGVGNTDLNNGAESPVAAFVDEFYLISSSTVDFALYDMERVEVLKGPQGTLFGRNATGGAFAFVTNKPDEELGGRLEATVGNYGRLGGEAMINVPITDNLQVRLSGFSDHHDGFVDNLYPGRSDFRESGFDALRGQLRYASDTWESVLKIDSGKAEGHLVGDNFNPMQKFEDDIIFADTDLVFGKSKDADPFSVAHNSKDWAENTVDHVLWTNNWEIGSFTLTSITGYLEQEYEITEDCDATELSVCNYHSFYESEHYSQEFRVTGGSEVLNWTAGVYYLNQEADGGYDFNAFNGLVDPVNLPTGGVLQHSVFDTEVESYAVYGQVEYSLSDSLTFIGGLRLQKDKKDFQQVDVQELVLTADFDFDGPESFTDANLTKIGVVLNGNNFTPAAAGDLTKLDEDGVSGTLQLNYTPNDEALYYASFRRGIKAGGFNVGVVPLALPSDQWRYDQEVLNAYEVGAKLEFPEAASRLNLAAFYYDYKDYQALSFQNLGQFFVNRPGTIYGAEAELFASPFEGFDMILGVSYLDTEVESVQRGVLMSTVADREMGEAPELTANMVLRYQFPISVGNVAVQLTGNYIGERYGDILNQTAATLESYSLWNASVEYTNSSDRFYARLWVKNLSDKEVAIYRIEITDLLNFGQDDFNEPRTYGLTLGYKF